MFTMPRGCFLAIRIATTCEFITIFVVQTALKPLPINKQLRPTRATISICQESTSVTNVP